MMSQRRSVEDSPMKEYLWVEGWVLLRLTEGCSWGREGNNFLSESGKSVHP